MTDEFRRNLEKYDSWREYYNKYVVFFPQYGSTFAGRLIGADSEGYLILNPFQGWAYSKRKGEIVREAKLIEGNSRIRSDLIATIEPTTKKSLEAACEYTNEHEEKNNKKDNSQNTK